MPAVVLLDARIVGFETDHSSLRCAMSAGYLKLTGLSLPAKIKVV
jgi:hypothetical protein